MSERIESKPRTVLDKVHHFYCDNCKKYLGYTTEYEDGYYPTLGEFSLRFHVGSVGWRYLTKHLCDDCQTELLDTLDNRLREFGFSDKEYQDDDQTTSYSTGSEVGCRACMYAEGRRGAGVS